MKNITLTLLFLGLFSGLSAQYVTIPDANFRALLFDQYPIASMLVNRLILLAGR